MALTALQRDLCRLLAAHRIASGEAYVAGGVALNELLARPRESRHTGVFHDTDEALLATWDSDRRLLLGNGYELEVLQERSAFIEARIRSAAGSVLMEWARDSAFRFFPLIEHPEFGLTLHPFDLATNKVLALVGRLEVRDWVDLVQCGEDIQPLGYLIWAACGKDPGLTPEGILSHGARTHYAAPEVLDLAWAGGPPNPATLARRWREMLGEAERALVSLPAAEIGACVLSMDGDLYRRDAGDLAPDLTSGGLRFHRGSIRGALPRIGPAS